MPVTFERTQLANGLRIQAEIDPHAHTAAAGFYVRTGARDEDASVMGVSHFLEHMMFKGTERRSADAVNREFDEIGANYNAFTSHEMTAFWAHVLPDYMPKALDILSDILRPALREEDFQTERGVILEEIAMYDDSPFWRLYERVMETYYGPHGLGFRVLGTPDTIKALTRDQMQTYFDDRYSADNTTVVLAGNLDFDTVVQQIESACGHWSTTDPGRQFPDITYTPSEMTVDDPKVNRHYMVTMAPAPSIQDDQRYAAHMLAQLLGSSEGSLLYWALVDPGLAEEAQVGFEGRDHVGVYYIYTSCSPERADQVEQIIDEQVKTCMEQVTADDLERERNKFATSVTLAGEQPSGRMRRLGRQAAYREEYLTLEEQLKRIEAVTLDDLRAVYDAYPFAPATTGRLRPVMDAAAQVNLGGGGMDSGG